MQPPTPSPATNDEIARLLLDEEYWKRRRIFTHQIVILEIMMLGLMLMFCFFSMMAGTQHWWFSCWITCDFPLKLPLGPHRIQTQVRRSKYPTLVGKCHKTGLFFPRGCSRCTTFSWWKLGLEPSTGLWNPVCSQVCGTLLSLVKSWGSSVSPIGITCPTPKFRRWVVTGCFEKSGRFLLNKVEHVCTFYFHFWELLCVVERILARWA